MQTAPYLSYEARAEAGQRVAWSYYRRGPRCRRSPGCRHLSCRREWRVGDPVGLGLRPCLLAPQRLQCGVERLPRSRLARAAARTWCGRLLLGGPRRASLPPPAIGRASAEGGCALARKLLRPPGPRDAGRRQAASARSPQRHRPGRDARRTSAVPKSWSNIGQPWLAEDMLKHQAQIGGCRITMR